jgi:uncharacterized protein
MDEQALKELLARDNGEFRKVLEEHRACERELEELLRMSPVSEEAAVRERKIKKRKLALKDRMYRMMQEYRKSG